MKRKTTSRYTALLQGLTAEVNLGVTLLLWLNLPDYADRALFGAVVSEAVLIAAMVALALAVLVLAIAARLGKVVLRTCVMVVSLPVAGVGALAVGSLFSDPTSFLLLAMAWIFSALVVVALSRASGRRAG